MGLNRCASEMCAKSVASVVNNERSGNFNNQSKHVRSENMVVETSLCAL